LAQSNTIIRYVGKLGGLYPEDALDAARCDEILDVIEEADTKVGATMRMDDEAKRVARLALADGPLQTVAKALADRLALAGGEWFAGGKPSVADLKVFITTRQLRSGRLDHIPTDLVDTVAPSLVAHAERVAALPGVRAWYTKQGIG
jgi:glutathione S-transferase